LEIKVIGKGQGGQTSQKPFLGMGIFKPNAPNVTSTAATKRGQVCGVAWQPTPCGYLAKQRVMNGSRHGQWMLKAR